MQGLLTFVLQEKAHLLQLPRADFSFGGGANMDLRLSGTKLPDYLGKFSWLEEDGTWCLSIHPGSQKLVHLKNRPTPDTAVVLNDGDHIALAGLSARFNLLPVPPVLDGEQVRVLKLEGDGLAIGKGKGAEGESKLILDAEDGGVSRLQASIVKKEGAWHIVDQGQEETELNGRFFQEERLVIGDRFRTGQYQFEFTGRGLRRLSLSGGGNLVARDLSRIAGGRAILSDVNVDIPAGSFIGVLGGSGQGKSTFLTALCGLNPPDTGKVEIDGRPASDSSGGRIGFVPQDDIVHTELTVRRAIEYSAKLRLSDNPPPAEIKTLVEGIADRLSLGEHLHKPIQVLSGGQRKRVSIATELLAKPSIIFLDEPSSGLDPATEYYLMKFLRDLAGTDCTVIATTHVLGRSFLFDQVAFIQAGRLVYCGPDQDALAFFEESSLDDVYIQLAEEKPTAEEWEAKYRDEAGGAEPEAPIPKLHDDGAAEHARGPSLRRSLGTLLARQWFILTSDRANVAFLFAQAAAIAVLIGWVAPNPGMRSFLAVVAVLWFGTSNAAQQVVTEMPIFRRERVCGLGLNVYIASKVVFIFGITALQTLFLFLFVTGAAFVFHPAEYDEELLMEDRRLAKSDPVGDIDETPGAGVQALIRAFKFSRDEAEELAKPYVKEEAVDLSGEASLRDDNKPVLVYDEGTIVRKVEVVGGRLMREGIDPKSEEARARVKAELPSQQVMPGPPPVFLSGPLRALALTSIRWFGLQENVLDSAERKMLDSDGDALKDPYSPTGRILKHKAMPLLHVIAIPIAGQLLALFASALVGVAIGLTISSLVNTPTQAAMIVPLILIPQILFAGFVITLPEMTRDVRLVASVIPSYSAQRVNEISALYGQRVPMIANQTKIPTFFEGRPETVEWETDDGEKQTEEYETVSEFNTAFQNSIVRHDEVGQRRAEENDSGTERLKVKSTRADIRPYRTGMMFTRLEKAGSALGVLAAWFAACYAITLWSLRSKQPL